MTDDTEFGPPGGVAGTVAPLAFQLLSGLADRKAADRPLDAEHVARLRAAVLGRSATECIACCTEMRNQGVDLDDLTDRYIPAVARTLGHEWSEDEISFATTSVGAARLQWLLRVLEPAPLDREKTADDPGFLVLVPAGEDHTLGAVLLSNQLRRRGYYVTLLLAAEPESLRFQLRDKSFQAAMISTTFGHHVGDLRALVSAARLVIEEDAPVLIGGVITDERLDLKGLSGADYVAKDVDDALRLCMLKAVETAPDPA